MYVYPINFYKADGKTVVAKGTLDTDVSLISQNWNIVPANNGALYSATPGSQALPPTWAAVPNYLNQTSALSVNILNTYVTPTAGITLALSPGVVLPAGWAFSIVTNLLTYDGVTVNSSPTSISFVATLTATGANSACNTISIQGAGAPTGDVFAPTIPVGLAAGNITQTSASLAVLPSSDPAPAGIIWSGMGGYTLTVPGVAGSPFSLASAAGNRPNLVPTDIGAVTTPTTYSQNGADVTFSNTYANSSFTPGPDSTATAFQQLTGTGWILSCRIDSFVNSYQYAKVKLGFRNTLDPGSPYINICFNPFAQGAGFDIEARSAQGLAPTAPFARVAITDLASPFYMIMVQVSATTIAAYISRTGNLDNTSVSLGSYPYTFAGTFYGGGSTNTDPGQTVPYSVTMKQLSIQNLATLSQAISGLTANTAYNASITAKDAVPNVSAASATLNFTTLASSGGGFPTSRSKRTWPYAAYSFWNLPVGASMQLSPQSVMTLLAGANSVINGAPMGYFIEFEFNLTAPIQSSPFKVTGRNIYAQVSQLDWSLGNNLCAVTGTKVYNSNAGGDGLVLSQNPPLYPIPDNYVPNLKAWGSQGPHAGDYKANFCCSILLPDGTTVAQNQQFARCAAASDAASGRCYDTPALKGNTGYDNGGKYASSPDIHTGDGRFGPHGASRTSTLGGSLRKFDLDQGVIRHALKIIVPITWLNGTGNYSGEKIGYQSGYGYLWPAYSRDDNGQTYSGPSTYIRMGSHLVIPQSVTIGTSPSTGLGFETTLGRMMGQASQTYGIYIVDSIGGNSPLLWLVNVETDPTTGAAVPLDTYVKQMYGGLSMYQYNSYGRGAPGDGNLTYMWNRDMDRIWKSLHVDLSCAPPTIPLTGQGMGGGTAVVPYAPAFSD